MIKKAACNVANRTMFIGDNLDVLSGMNDACIDLIYLDPPFNSNRNYAAPVGSKAAGASFKDAWTLDDIDDAWIEVISAENKPMANLIEGIGAVNGNKDKAYLIFMARRLIELHRILKETGSIYLHCDPAMSHPLKLLMDCIFNADNFRSEIIWRIGWVSGYKTQKRGWIRNHDTVLYYVKSKLANNLFNKEYIPYADGYLRRDGRPPTGKGIPIEDTWNCHANDILDSIMIKSFSREKTGHPTQKPLALLERIIKASSNEGDLVLDPFCGCATACVAAERLGREWIGIDLSDKSIKLINERLQEEEVLWRQVGKGRHIIPRTDLPERDDIASLRIADMAAHKKTLYGALGGYCQGCGVHFEPRNLEVDHILPRSKGGQDIASNLTLLCGSCNRIKGNRSWEYLVARLKEVRNSTPKKKS